MIKSENYFNEETTYGASEVSPFIERRERRCCLTCAYSSENEMELVCDYGASDEFIPIPRYGLCSKYKNHE